MNSDKINLKVKCRCCGSEHTIKVNLDDFEAWRNGDLLVQEAFPYLNASQRELLLTRTCQKCWDEMFNGVYE